MREAFVGIDVAFSKHKRLPIVVTVWDGEWLSPLHLKKWKDAFPPKGRGNAQTINEHALAEFVEETADYLRKVERQFDVAIRRVALDSPSDPKISGTERRLAELALDARRISCFGTPSLEEFKLIRTRVAEHLLGGGAEAYLPHANQLWMLVGFALFSRLRREWECLEVFPQAIISSLGANAVHKSRADGLKVQFKAVVPFTGWPQSSDVFQLRNAAFGSLHDCFDAYIASWVAGLDEVARIALGKPPCDVIWIPRTLQQ